MATVSRGTIIARGKKTQRTSVQGGSVMAGTTGSYKVGQPASGIAGHPHKGNYSSG